MPEIFDVKWRVGRKLGRTVYACTNPDDDPTCHVLLGMFDSAEVAAHVVVLHNQERAQRYGEVFLLSEREHEAIALAGQLATQLGMIAEFGPAREGDIAEAIHHIHALQNMVLAQAAARAYSSRYRLLGGGDDPPPPNREAAQSGDEEGPRGEGGA